MWKKSLLGTVSFTIVGFFCAVFINDQISAFNTARGTANYGAADSLRSGDSVHLGGSAMNDDMHTVLGVKDGYVYLLRTDSANNGTLSNYNNALTYANDTYKAQLGSIGNAHFSLSGNTVSLISKTELQNLGVVSGDNLNGTVSQITDKWWLRDANTSTNRASFVSKDNSLNADGGIKKTTVSNLVYNDPNATGSCSVESAGENGVMLITSYNEPQVIKGKYISKATIHFVYPDAMGMSYISYANASCTSGGGTMATEALNKNSNDLIYTKTSGKESWETPAGQGGALITSLMLSPTHNWRPKIFLDNNGNVSLTSNTITTNFTGGTSSTGTCYARWYDSPTLHISSNSTFTSPKGIKWGTRTFTVTASVSGTPTVTNTYCSTLTNNAGSALIRPYLKIATNDILMRNNGKRTYSPSSTLSTDNSPQSDNSGEYLTLQTSTINVALQSGASGVSGSRYEVKKPSTGTTVTLPLSFTGPIEGNRYVFAEATDKDGNTVYGVLQAVSSGNTDSVDIDFSNLLPDGGDSFQVTLYLEDEGSKNTAYRSLGTPITVKFIKSDSSFAFTNQKTTNIKIGSADVKETITTDNTEITTSGSNAVKYTLSGGISGTGLSVTNDTVDPKGFTISIGNTLSPNLPTDFTLKAELETTLSTKATASKTIHVFQEISDFKWTPTKAGSYLSAEVLSNKVIGQLEVKNGLPKFTYELTSPSNNGYDVNKAKDNNSFMLSSTPLGSNQKAELKTSTALAPGTYYIQCKVTDEYGDELYTDFTITVDAKEQNFIYTDIGGKELSKTGNKYSPYQETYAPDKQFQLYTSGNPVGSSVTYQLKDGSSSDVISVDTDGTVHILNASSNSDIGHVTVEAISHDPSGTYVDKVIELPITIKKGNRTVSFADDPVYVVNGTGSVTPVVLVDGVSDTTGTATFEVDPNESSIAWTNNGTDIQYSYNGDTGKDIKLSVSLPGNRNYENALGNGILHILGTDEAMLTVSSPGKIIYGDRFSVRSTQDDSASNNVQYAFMVDNNTYVSSPTVNGNEAEFDALKYSGNTDITITVTRTADGEVPLSKKVKVKVLPKPVQITIEDKEKLKGEANPPLTVEDFTSQLVTWNGTQDVIQSSDVKLSTTANQTSLAGSYPIKGDVNYLNKTYPNYTFTFEDGTLTITEENIEDDWYHVETDDGKPYQGEWTNQDVNIVSDHSEYVNISKDQSSWNRGFVSVVQEGNYEQSFWMKKDSGAITSEKKERIKIDKTAPKVKNIKAKDSNSKLQDIINKLSGGIFFKPGTSFEITTDDKNADLEVSGTGSIAYKIYKQDSDKSYGSAIKQDILTVTNEKANVTISETTGTYKVCVTSTDQAGNEGTESCHEVTLKKIDVDEDGDGKPDFNDPDGDGCPDLNIKWKGDDGKWVTINGDRNYDKIPDLNIDSDGDGKPDLNVDTDHDGNPDLNLVILKKSDWKPKTCVNVDDDKGIKEEYCTGTSVKPQINIDLDGDLIPDINIDNNGDMKADVNIDTNDDGKADFNINTLETWKPDKNYTYQKFAYDTMKDVKPYLNIDTDGDGRPDVNIDLDDDGTADINIDTDGDRIPDIDIDSTGDGQPDINIDNDGDGKPDENIIQITEWKPEHNVDGAFPYDTMTFEEKKELEDNGVKVEKPDGTFAANVTLKVTDITKDKRSEVAEKAKDLIGEQSVIQVFDVKLLENGKEIQPDGMIKVKIPVKANIKNPSLLVLNEDGEYEKVDTTFEDGYLIYETDQLGQFTIIGDMDDQEPDTDVKGAYYPGANMGGALTGDSTNMMMYMGLGCMSIGMMLFILYKRRQAN